MCVYSGWEGSGRDIFFFHHESLTFWFAFLTMRIIAFILAKLSVQNRVLAFFLKQKKKNNKKNKQEKKYPHSRNGITYDIIRWIIWTTLIIFWKADIWAISILFAISFYSVPSLCKHLWKWLNWCLQYLGYLTCELLRQVFCLTKTAYKTLTVCARK